MSQVPDKTEERQSPAAQFRAQLEARLAGFQEALPPHITAARFKSVIAWAVMANPELLAADRLSLFEACLAAANDGLLPDKKQGALVVYNTKLPKVDKRDPDEWVKKVQWLPMVRGIITKIYNTGKVKSVNMAFVYGGDHFEYYVDDKGEHLEHRPAEDRSKSIMRRVYAHVVMKEEAGGGVFAEVLDMADVEKVKTASKNSKYGPWVDWYEEMAKKTALKRLSKRLPISNEIETVLSRDNYLYEFDQAAPATRRRTGSLTEQLDDLAAGGRPMLAKPSDSPMAMDQDFSGRDREPVTNSEPGPSLERGSEDAGKRASARNATAAASSSSSGTTSLPDDGTPSEEQLVEARRRGATAKADGMTRRACPREYRDNNELATAWAAGWDNGQAAREPGEEG
ncbi:recombinase RecT [Mesorhizobium sp. ANAO-SY3R2]|uniref:recombinase RecT n=1 Tax=Mesorhizobium sp. ANAO-SY3R2 TaxID=3166644 RepID=UPI00366AFE51